MPSNQKIKIVWLSANLFGYELLKEALKIQDTDIMTIITLGAKAKTTMYDGIENQKWHKFAIPVYEIENINKEVNLLRSLNPDMVIMAGWRQMIGEKILNIPKEGFIGFHPTLLPKGRGPAPIINTILKGLEKSGVTMFYLNEGLDGGEIIGQEEFKIENNDYAENLYNKIIKAGKMLVKKYLPLLAKKEAPRIPQNEQEVTCFQKRTLDDNEIKLERDSPEEIDRKIRAFSKPYKGAYIRLKGKKLIIWKADLNNEES